MNSKDNLKKRLEKLEKEKEELKKKLENARNNRRQDYLRRIVEEVPELDKEKHFMATEQPSNKRFNKKGLEILADHLIDLNQDKSKRVTA